MTDLSHLNALQLRLSHERAALTRATTDGERALRAVWVAQLEKEMRAEYDFLGLEQPVALSDDDLLAALFD